jgi:hypothetical protein
MMAAAGQKNKQYVIICKTKGNGSVKVIGNGKEANKRPVCVDDTPGYGKT